MESLSCPRLHYEILLDHGETPNKCTIAPLSYRPDFRIRRFPKGKAIPPLLSDILLHMDGESLESFRPLRESLRSVAAIDCIWRRLSPIVHWVEGPLPRLARIPPGFVTAYPRRSQFGDADPGGGLATIEALFIGAAFLGQWDETLLREYYFGERFLEINQRAFTDYEIWPLKDESENLDSRLPLFNPKHPRNAVHRRIARGRIQA